MLLRGPVSSDIGTTIEQWLSGISVSKKSWDMTDPLKNETRRNDQLVYRLIHDQAQSRESP